MIVDIKRDSFELYILSLSVRREAEDRENRTCTLLQLASFTLGIKRLPAWL